MINYKKFQDNFKELADKFREHYVEIMTQKCCWKFA